jgi:hypothetical protein
VPSSNLSASQKADLKAQIAEIDPTAQYSPGGCSPEEYAQHEHIAEQLYAIRYPEEARAKIDEVVKEANLSRTAEERLQAAIRAKTRQLEIEHEWKVRKAYQDYARPIIREQLEEISRLQTALELKGGMMTAADFKRARSAVHTDSYGDIELPEKIVKGLNWLFQWLVKHEDVLVARIRERRVTDIPESTEEILRRMHR